MAFWVPVGFLHRSSRVRRNDYMQEVSGRGVVCGLAKGDERTIFVQNVAVDPGLSEALF